MNIKELKELIKDLPEDMRVVEAYDGPMTFCVVPLTLSIENLYHWPDNTALENEDKLWVEPLEDKTVKEVVLCVRTW